MPKYRLAFREQDLGMLYKIKPLTDQSQITIFFQIPDYDLDSRYKFAPNDYFTSLIGHEGESKISIWSFQFRWLNIKRMMPLPYLANFPTF